MREIEFLPDWYPQLRKRKRMVMLQAWTTLVLLSGLCLWCWLSGRNIQTASASLRMLETELNETDSQLHQLSVEVEQQRQLKLKDQIMARLGGQVEATRLLNAIDASMPVEMSVVALSADVEEFQRSGTGLAALAATAQHAAPPLMERRLKIRLTGIGPSDTTGAQFTESLQESGLFESVAMSYARERLEQNRSMREFEVTFSVNLNLLSSQGNS